MSTALLLIYAGTVLAVCILAGASCIREILHMRRFRCATCAWWHPNRLRTSGICLPASQRPDRTLPAERRTPADFPHCSTIDSGPCMYHKAQKD